MDAVNELNGEIYIITISSRFQNRCVCAISLLFCFRLFQLFGEFRRLRLMPKPLMSGSWFIIILLTNQVKKR